MNSPQNENSVFIYSLYIVSSNTYSYLVTIYNKLTTLFNMT